MMIFMDPPEHDVNRKLVVNAFTPRAVGALEPFIRATAVRFLDRLRERGRSDFVEEFAAALPMNVIMELVGVPAADRDQLRRWMDGSLERVEEPPFVPSSAVQAMADMYQYWTRLVSTKRDHPDDSLLSRLCGVEMPDDLGRVTRLTDAEIVGFCALIGSAGTETLTKLLGNAIVLFYRYPKMWRTVVTDPATIPGAVEEVLRYWAPSQYQGRVLTDDITVHGVDIPKGARVLLLTGSANRDERQYPDPDRFDIQRASKVPLGFGHGTHFCLGASLARLEARVALEEFALRFPRYTVDESSCQRVRMSNVHGFAHIPITV
jgi:cytochrome P450